MGMDLDAIPAGLLANYFGSATHAGLRLRDFDKHGQISKRLRRLDPIAAARSFGSLLLHPALQPHTVRIEVLAQLAVATGTGPGRLDGATLRTSYNLLEDGWAGRMEDPPEDVFVAAVRCRAGNFRVIEGMWEGGGFYLQRIVDLVEALPAGRLPDDLRAAALAMLRLSELICERAKLRRWQAGGMDLRDSIDVRTADKLLAGRGRLRFSLDDLRAAGIEPGALAPFMFDMAEAPALLDAPLAGSALERRPIVYDGRHWHVILPTALGAAIRMAVIEATRDSGLADAFNRALANGYGRLWHDTLHWGGRARLQFAREGDAYWAEHSGEIDRGLHLHFVFVTDGLDDYEQAGFEGINTSATPEGMDRRIAAAWDRAQGPDYRGGLTLIVGCGVGRGAAYACGDRETPGWRVEFASAYDLHTLIGLPGFDPLTLWRLLDQRDEAQRLGLDLMNVNGLINLVGWSRQLDGHVVPHGQLPDDGQPVAMLAVDQTALRQVRIDVSRATDAQVAYDVNGRPLRIRRDFHDTFAEDAESWVYGSEDPGASGMPMSVFLTGRRAWWGDLLVPHEVGGGMAYERWKTVQLWLARAAPVLDALPELPEGAVQWTACFEGAIADGPARSDRLDFAAARAELTVDVTGSVVRTTASPRFEQAWLNEENVAERALVAAFVDGVAELAGGADEVQCARWVDAIVRHPMAKQQHGFMARGFRDWVRGAIGGLPLLTTREDDAASRLGLGWKVRERGAGAWIEGKADCCAFLRDLVRRIEDELCAALRGYDRRAMIEQLLLNGERVAQDREMWNRTATSNIALRNDRAAALDTLRHHQFKLNAAGIASRLLIEIAVCECPLTGGIVSGKLELSWLMARILLVHSFGGWSDAIHWDAMQPKLRVTPLGDVHGNFDWHDEIAQPFSEQVADERTEDAVADYAKNLEELPINPTASFGVEFDAACCEQLGVTLQQTRVFIEHLENRGRRQGQAIIDMTLDDLRRFEIDDQVVDGEPARKLVEALTMTPRVSWRDVPVGCQPKDGFPWRFRRRLSLLRRPLVALGDADGTILVAPGLVRDALGYMLSNYWTGDFPQEQLTPLMRGWRGKAVAKRGLALATEVAAALGSVGWTTWIERQVTELLRQGFDRDYGDVDVLARRGGRVIAIECKDLQYAKTHGEVAGQVRDYRGEERDGKGDDLRKHLDRMDVLRAHLPALGRFVGLAELAEVESHLVFRSPTPVIFALGRSQHDVRASILDDVAKI